MTRPEPARQDDPLFLRRQEQARRAEERLEDYLDHLCAPMLGVMPYADRLQVRREARTHLEMLQDEFSYDGHAPVEAAEMALAEYGAPWQIGQQLLEAWHRSRVDSPVVTPGAVAPESAAPGGGQAQDAGTTTRRHGRRLLRSTGSAPLVAFVACAVPAIAIQAFVLHCASSPPPERWALYPYVLAAGLLAPLVSGLLVGAFVPARATAATARVWCAVILPHALVSGLLLLPQSEGVWFTLFQAVYGLPAALLAVCGAEAMARYRRMQQFWGRGGGRACRAEIAGTAAAPARR